MIATAFAFALLVIGTGIAIVGMFADHDGIIFIGGLMILCSIGFGVALVGGLT